MRLREIDSGPDMLQFYAEVYNPFGYIRFVFQEDRDWWEKAEHAAIATGTVALPFHVLTAMSSGGYWANLPPGMAYRAASMKRFTHNLFYGFARNTGLHGRALLANPATLPLVASLGLMYVGAKARPTDEDVWQIDRIQRARAQAMGARDPYGVGTGPWFVSHGYFHDSPHHGDHWYSFNPQDIDGSHR